MALTNSSLAHRCLAIGFGLSVIAQTGCADLPLTPRHTRSVPTELRGNIDTIAIIATSAPPRLNLDDFPQTPASASAAAAWQTFSTCTGGGGHAGGDFAALAYLLWVAVCGGAAGVSAALAQNEQPSPQSIASGLSPLRVVAEGSDAQKELADHVAKAVEQGGWPRMRRIESGHESTQTMTGMLHAAGVDHIVELKMTEVATIKAPVDSTLVRAKVSVQARLLRLPDNAEEFSAIYTYTSEARKPAEWVGDGGAKFQNVVDNAYDAISISVRDNFFFAYPFPYKWYNKSGMSWFAGLQAEAPGEFETVETREPVLRWEVFPRASDRKEAPDAMARVEKVAYDLRVADGATGKVIYQWDGLPVNTHTFEQALQPGATYRWTVRARFDLDHRGYVTEWATVQGGNGETGPFVWYGFTVKPGSP